MSVWPIRQVVGLDRDLPTLNGEKLSPQWGQVGYILVLI